VFQAQTYNIELPEFYGPFDLLLFFIERDELDIYDIPIAKITEDFLLHLKAMEVLNIDLASEFILVASTLMQIKVKMLLPRKELDEQGNEIDPRQELVDRLLEYKRYKDILEELQQLEERRNQMQERGNVVEELQILANRVMADAELENLSLFRLLKAYDQVMQQFQQRAQRIVHTIVRIPYTIEQCRQDVMAHLQAKPKQNFGELFEICENRLHAIYLFLALLELLQQEQLAIELGEGLNNFEVSLLEGATLVEESEGEKD
jgi:segregation and condensation protein A